MALTKLYLIRHAEAEGNLYRRIHGWYDSLITENGYRQIAALEKRFKDIQVDAVYSSDLFRTRTTAGAICKPKGLELNTRRALREINTGVWEDMTWAEAGMTYPEQMLFFNTNDSRYHCEGSETFEELRQRVSGALLNIAASHPGKTVAVFSHGTAIRNALGLFLGYTVEETYEKVAHGDNTAVSLLEAEDGKIRVVFMNDNSHLPEELSTFARQFWWKSREGGLQDANLWFRPLDMENNSEYYYRAREDAWLTIHGSMLHFDGEGFLRDAIDQARYDERSVMQVMMGDRPIGVLQLNLRRDADKGVGSIPFLYLEPDYTKRGLGVQLLGQAVSTYRPLGRKYLRLRCAPDNEVAQRFYKKYGFQRIGAAPGSRVPLDLLEKYIGY